MTEAESTTEVKPEILSFDYVYFGRLACIWPSTDAKEPPERYYAIEFALADPSNIELPEIDEDSVMAYLDIFRKTVIRVRHDGSQQEETIEGESVQYGPRLYIAEVDPAHLMPEDDINSTTATSNLETIMNLLLYERGPQSKRFRKAGEDLARRIGRLTVTA